MFQKVAVLYDLRMLENRIVKTFFLKILKNSQELNVSVPKTWAVGSKW